MSRMEKQEHVVPHTPPHPPTPVVLRLATNTVRAGAESSSVCVFMCVCLKSRRSVDKQTNKMVPRVTFSYCTASVETSRNRSELIAEESGEHSAWCTLEGRTKGVGHGGEHCNGWWAGHFSTPRNPTPLSSSSSSALPTPRLIPSGCPRTEAA